MSDLLRRLEKNPNLKDDDGNTALWWFASEGEVGTIQVLLECGADPNIPCQANTSPLMAAAKYSSLADSSLQTIATLSLLIAAGADVNQHSDSGITALMCAAHGGQVEIADYLFSHDANANLVDSTGMTAADWAKRHGHPEVARHIASYWSG